MTSQLTWMGEVWNVADRAAGGPFVNSFASSQVSVDGSGFLHLRVDPDGSGGSIGAELSSVLEGRGYGTYKIEVGSQISGIHPNVVFGGMFTYGTDAAYGHREIDACEQSAWSGATGPWTLGHVVWMPSSASDSYAPRGGFDAADVVTLTDTTQTTILIWEPTRITIRTYRGLSTDPANLYRESVVTEDQTVTFDIEGGGSYTGSATIPVPGDERVHFNLWVAPNFSGTSDPATVTPTDIIIRSFRYTAPSEWAPTTQPLESTASSWFARTPIPNEGLTWVPRWLVSPADLVGFNWPNASRTYINHWDQGNAATEVLYTDRQRPWAVAQARQVSVVRAFWWDESTINTYNGNPTQAVGDIMQMLDHAHAQGVQVILSSLLDRPTIERLNNSTPYATDLLAQEAMLTPGSTPYTNFEALLNAVVPQIASHPGLYSIEAVNEPGFELGPDAGTTTAATMAAFLGHFNTVLKNAGAQRITMGAWPHFDPNSFYSDAQIATIYTDAYSIDAHFYPPSSTDTSVSTVAHADSKIAAHEAVIARIRSVLGRPTMPAAIGEVGSIPAVWAERMISQAVVRGWRIMPWAFSHYDEWVFDEDTQPQVLQFIQATNVAYGAAIGEPDPDLDTPSWSPRTLIPNEGLTWAPRTPTGETSLWVGSALWVGTALWP